MQNPNWWQTENNPLWRAPNFPPKMLLLFLWVIKESHGNNLSEEGQAHEMQSMPFSSFFTFFSSSFFFF